jgi:hypothetical protein
MTEPSTAGPAGPVWISGPGAPSSLWVFLLTAGVVGVWFFPVWTRPRGRALAVV